MKKWAYHELLHFLSFRGCNQNQRRSGIEFIVLYFHSHSPLSFVLKGWVKISHKEQQWIIGDIAKPKKHIGVEEINWPGLIFGELFLIMMLYFTDNEASWVHNFSFLFPYIRQPKVNMAWMSSMPKMNWVLSFLCFNLMLICWTQLHCIYSYLATI